MKSPVDQRKAMSVFYWLPLL